MLETKLSGSKHPFTLLQTCHALILYPNIDVFYLSVSRL